jgi:hypothetical protein
MLLPALSSHPEREFIYFILFLFYQECCFLLFQATLREFFYFYFIFIFILSRMLLPALSSHPEREFILFLFLFLFYQECCFLLFQATLRESLFYFYFYFIKNVDSCSFKPP